MTQVEFGTFRCSFIESTLLPRANMWYPASVTRSATGAGSRVAQLSTSGKRVALNTHAEGVLGPREGPSRPPPA